jgi:hypothetical protein
MLFVWRLIPYMCKLSFYTFRASKIYIFEEEFFFKGTFEKGKNDTTETQKEPKGEN